VPSHQPFLQTELRNFVQSVSAADLRLDLLLILFLLGFSRESKTFAQEVRAIIPLAKGTEVLFNYQFSLLERAERRESLSKSYQFDCSCELCTLPDDLSNALDTKIKLANEASEYLDRFLRQREPDAIRAVQSLDTFMSTIIRERLLVRYSDFFYPLRLLAVFGNPTLLRRVGHSILRLFRRYLGTGYFGGNAGVESASWLLDEALEEIADSEEHEYFFSIGTRGVDAQRELEKAVSSIISNLQSLP
jgi:hypothetical protein